MKKGFIVLVCIFAAIFILFRIKDALIKLSVEKGVRIVTGLQLKIDSFTAGIIRPIVIIRGMRLFNPSGYPDKTMLDMPEIFVDYDLPAIIGGNVHLRQMRIDLKEFIVVKNRDGRLNLDALKVVRFQKEGVRPQDAEKGKPIRIQIDDLRLKVGRVLYKDYSRGSTPVVREFNVNIDEKYTDIKDPYALVSLIVVRTLTNTSISQLANFDIGGLKFNLTDTLSQAQSMAAKTASMAQETVKKAAENTGGIVTGAAATVNKAARSLFQLSFPEGKSEDKN